MSIYKQESSGNYWIRISVAGKKIRKTTGTKDAAAAREFEKDEAARAWREIKLGDRSALPWREAAARWLTETRKRSKDKDEYILAWFAQHLKDEPLSAIDSRSIQFLRELLLSEGSSESNVDRYMALLRAILRKCRDEWHYLTAIPKVPMFHVEQAEPQWLTREQFARLVEELPEHLKLCARFAVLTGLRMRAMLGLTWDRVDLDKGHAWVPLAGMKGKRSFGFPLSSAAVEVLKECRAAYPAGDRCFQYAAKRKDAAQERRWRPVDDCNTAAFKKALTRAGLPDMPWHGLRHTFASWAAQGGVSTQELMQLGAWKSYAMALRYSHLNAEHLSRAAEIVSGRAGNGHTSKDKKRVSGSK